MSFPALPHAALTLVCCMLATAHSHAQSVALTGKMGSKVLLVINGAPKALSLNESHQGVRVVHIQGESATIEMQGQRQTLRMGEAPSSVGAGLPSGRKVVLRADNRGHFRENGFINNKPMQYMVDTGASSVAMGQADAERMGIDFQKGQPVTMRTANGNAQGWRIKLDTVRVGDITAYGVEAVVGPQPMPYVLLGNSFLSHLHLTRQGNEMVLEQR